MNLTERLRSDGHDPDVVVPLLFFKPTHAYGCLSQFSAHGVRLHHPWTGALTWYPSVEHWFQAAKATDAEAYSYVLDADTAYRAKERGREIELRDDWGFDETGACYAFMATGSLAKAQQHAQVARVLRFSGDRPIYEDSPVDDIWGWRYRDDYRGRNLLGKCWMQVRSVLV